MNAGNPSRSVPHTRTHMFLGWNGYLFGLIGILLLSYCGYVLLEARIYQAYQSWRFEKTLQSSKPPVSSAELPQLPAPPALPVATPAPAKSLAISDQESVPLGRIEISRIGLKAMIMEGIDAKTLRHAVGHVPRTALPGQLGNIAISGHRDTFFRELRNVRLEDDITLTTSKGIYRYRVDSTRVIDPQDISVLEDDGDSTLTLVTCYPFNFIGAAPQRFIVHAHRIPQ